MEVQERNVCQLFFLAVLLGTLIIVSTNLPFLYSLSIFCPSHVMVVGSITDLGEHILMKRTLIRILTLVSAFIAWQSFYIQPQPLV